MKLAIRWEVKVDDEQRSIQLFDENGKVHGFEAKWNGSFYCSDNQLTSLEGAPKEVGGSFYCENNQLTSLEGAPKEVGESFYCCRNQLTSLEGAPKEVGGNFKCSHNQLTSLEGAPKEVGGSFYCEDNQLTSLEGAPKEITNIKKYIDQRIYESKKSKGYLLADGILQKIISNKTKGDIEIFKVRNIGNRLETFCVKRNDNFSHGKTLKLAIEDLQYKISDRDVTEFEDWTHQTVTTKSKMIEAYRKITGACSIGTKSFVENNNITDEVTVAKVIDITSGHYGHETFVEFFRR